MTGRLQLCLAGVLCVLAVGISCWLCLPPAACAGKTTLIEQVDVQVRAEKNLPEPVRQRMEKSVAVIAGQLLEGRKLTEVGQARADYAGIIQQVFDKVLVGYTVSRVAVDVQDGSGTARVQVFLVPWQDTIQKVRVDVSVEGMPKVAEALLQQDVSGMEEVFQSSLQGLPVAAADWSHGLLKKQVAAFLQERAPEFKADFDVQVAADTRVKVVLYPLLPVVRTVDLSMRSDTVLNAGLLTKRQKMQSAVDGLIGLPVPFVERHRQEFEHYLADVLNGDADFRRWSVDTQVALTPGEQLKVMSRSDSDIYRVRLEGWADVGNSWGNQHDTSLKARLHLGRMLSERSELFSQLDFYPQSVKWDWDVGYRYVLPSGTSAGMRYDLRNDYFKVDVLQPISRKWLLRYEYRELEHHSEYGIRYKLHDFLSLEYAVDSRGSWLRFIGYF
ncbi:MAG: acylphosphatase [Selenomonadaceae bacterium]|nr:acylphosphatase [Selenomonadaceae bacterium]